VLLIVFLIIAAREGRKNMNNKNNAKYAFYYLLSLVALAFTAIAAGMVAFGIINKTVADAILNYASSDGQLKFAISALFIAAPVFYGVSALINRGLRKGDLDKESDLRRWLTYFLLLVSFIVILGSFIGVINNFLSGELTLRFVLKALTVIIISGTIFSYYLYDLKRDPAAKDKVAMIFTYASAALVLAAFIAAWFFVESPATARARRLDQTLISNIYSLENAVNSYYEKTKALPDNMDQVVAANVYLDARLLQDQESGDAIVYQKTGEQSFEFCATFRLDSAAPGDNNPIIYPGDNKNHRAGYQCLPGNFYLATPKTIDFAPIN